jgi:hypothetical protein
LLSLFENEGAVLVSGSILLIIAFKKLSSESVATVVDQYEKVINPLGDLDVTTDPRGSQFEIETVGSNVCNNDRVSMVEASGSVAVEIENKRIPDLLASSERVIERG